MERETRRQIQASDREINDHLLAACLAYKLQINGNSGRPKCHTLVNKRLGELLPFRVVAHSQASESKRGKSKMLRSKRYVAGLLNHTEN